MKSLLARLRALLAYEPAVAGWITSGGLAVVLAFVFHASKTEEAAITSIATALAAAYAAFRTRPLPVGVLVGALATAVTAWSAFGFHVSATQLGAGEAIASGILALLFRSNVTPKAALKAKAVAPIQVGSHP